MNTNNTFMSSFEAFIAQTTEKNEDPGVESGKHMLLYFTIILILVIYYYF